MNDLIKKFEKVLRVLLFLFAIVNIQYLFFTLSPLMVQLENTVTQISALILATILICKLLQAQNIRIKLRNAIPDLAFIIILFSVQGSNRVFQTYLLGRQLFSLIKSFFAQHVQRKRRLRIYT